MIRYARSLLAALPIVAFPVVPREAAPPRADGYLVTMTITSDAAGLAGPMLMTLKVAGTKIRIEMDMSAMMGAAGAGAGQMMSGAFMLPQDDGRIAMILPNMQNPMGGGGMGMGMIMDMQSMAGTMKDLGASLEITDMKVDVQDLGAGEVILGHKTKHYKMSQKYLMGGKPYEGVSDIWIATDMTDAEAGFKKFTESFGMQFVGAATSKAVQAEIQSKTPPGFAMRTVVAMKTPEGPQNMKLEVTKAEKSAFEDKEFTVPAGIQLMDMGGMMKRGH